PPHTPAIIRSFDFRRRLDASGIGGALDGLAGRRVLAADGAGLLLGRQSPGDILARLAGRPSRGLVRVPLLPRRALLRGPLLTLLRFLILEERRIASSCHRCPPLSGKRSVSAPCQELPRVVGAHALHDAR